ncbi:MAG: hypothetical protein V7751_14985 [Pseudoalteromonas distincta]
MQKRSKRSSRLNYGWGRQLRYAMCQAVHSFYGWNDHFGTRRTHGYRIRIFARFCLRQGINDARLVTQSTLDLYGEYLRNRLQGEYVWPDGTADRQVSVAYAHNLISSANTALYAMRGNSKIDLSALVALSASRRHVRDEPAEADREAVTLASQQMVAKGDGRGAAVALLTRHWGMRAQEATLQDLQRMKREIAGSGGASILEGCKGGREDRGRWIPATPERVAALEFALKAHPIGSRCMLNEGESVKVFYQRELNRCRRVLRSLGITSYRELRAGFAADVYESVTGVPPMKGFIVPRDLDKKARREVARVLGHGREQISSGYVGGYR